MTTACTATAPAAFSPRPLAWLDGRMPGWQSRQLAAMLSRAGRSRRGVVGAELAWSRHLRSGGSREDDIAAFAIAYGNASRPPHPRALASASLELWLDHAARAGTPGQFADAVSECILAAAEPGSVSGDAPEHALRSADLALLYLAGSRDEVDAELDGLRRDYPQVGDLEFEAHLSGTMHTLLLSPAVFRTEPMRHLERKARANAARVFSVAGRTLSRTVHAIPFN